jgi:hypothetical protein
MLIRHDRKHHRITTTDNNGGVGAGSGIESRISRTHDAHYLSRLDDVTLN